MNGQPANSARSSFSEERIDVRRYLTALRRSTRLIVLIVIVVTGSTLVVSLLLPPKYSASATLVQEDIASSIAAPSSDEAQRRLLTTAALLDTQRVLARAAPSIRGESADSLEDKVESSVDENANIIEVTAVDENARKAAAIANGISLSFLSERKELERSGLDGARRSLEQQIERLRGTPNADAEIAAIRERISELGVQLAGAGSGLQLAQPAEVPSSPSSPLPLRNSILALFAAIFLGVLVALGRDQLVPRVDSSRDLSRLIEVPVLVEVPNVRPGLGRRTALLTAAENESYQSLRASLEMALPPTEQRTVLVSSAVHAEGKTTVTARLGRALVEAGHSTLLVSADLRRPELHNHFDLPPGAGVEEILSVLHQSAGRADPTFRRALVAAIAEVPLKGRGRPRPGKLGLLRSGTTVPDPARLLSPETMSGFVEELQRLDYQYVLFDGPPLLGIADSQVMSQEVDHLLIVSRLDALTLGSANDLRDALSLTASRPLGLVVIGGRFEMSPYYLHSAPAPAAGARSG